MSLDRHRTRARAVATVTSATGTGPSERMAQPIAMRRRAVTSSTCTVSPADTVAPSATVPEEGDPMIRTQTRITQVVVTPSRTANDFGCRTFTSTMTLVTT